MESFLDEIQCSLKKQHIYDSGSPVTTKNKKNVSFANVVVYYFDRQQGYSSIPKIGGCTLGMTYSHSHSEQFNCEEYTILRNSIRLSSIHKNQLRYGLRQSTHDNIKDSYLSTAVNQEDNSNIVNESSNFTDLSSKNKSQLINDIVNNINKNKMNSRIHKKINGFTDYHNGKESYNIAQALTLQQRIAILKSCGITEIDVNEKIECHAIRTSRLACGCKCKDACLPETCACFKNGICCQVDRLSFPCSCLSNNCFNEFGRQEFSINLVQNHRIEQIKRYGGRIKSSPIKNLTNILSSQLTDSQLSADLNMSSKLKSMRSINSQELSQISNKVYLTQNMQPIQLHQPMTKSCSDIDNFSEKEDPKINSDNTLEKCDILLSALPQYKDDNLQRSLDLNITNSFNEQENLDILNKINNSMMINNNFCLNRDNKDYFCANNSENKDNCVIISDDDLDLESDESDNNTYTRNHNDARFLDDDFEDDDTELVYLDFPPSDFTFDKQIVYKHDNSNVEPQLCYSNESQKDDLIINNHKLNNCTSNLSADNTNELTCFDFNSCQSSYYIEILPDSLKQSEIYKNSNNSFEMPSIFLENIAVKSNENAQIYGDQNLKHNNYVNMQKDAFVDDEFNQMIDEICSAKCQDLDASIDEEFTQIVDANKRKAKDSFDFSCQSDISTDIYCDFFNYQENEAKLNNNTLFKAEEEQEQNRFSSPEIRDRQKIIKTGKISKKMSPYCRIERCDYKKDFSRDTKINSVSAEHVPCKELNGCVSHQLNKLRPRKILIKEYDKKVNEIELTMHVPNYVVMNEDIKLPDL